MNRIQAQHEFDKTTTVARCRHQEALRAAITTFNAAIAQAQTARQARIAKAKADWDEIKSREPEPVEVEMFAKLRAALVAAVADDPGWLDEARGQLAKDVETADGELNEALAAARQKLLAA